MRQQRLTIKFTVDSLLRHYQQIYNNLEILRNRSTQDYNRVIEIFKHIKNEPGVVMQLDAARNNALSTFDKYFSKKIELLKLQKDIIQLLQKDKDKDGVKKGLGDDDKLQMQKMYSELIELETKGVSALKRGENKKPKSSYEMDYEEDNQEEQDGDLDFGDDLEQN